MSLYLYLMYLQALQKLGETLGWHTLGHGFERFVLSFTLLIFPVYLPVAVRITRTEHYARKEACFMYQSVREYSK